MSDYLLMKKALTWRSVSGGIAGLVALVLILFAVLKYARTGALRGDKFRLYVAVPDGSNILKGTEVWLNGQRVGTVAGVAFAPPSAPVDQRVVIVTDVLSGFRDHIRLDSRASLQSGGTIIGAPVVYLTSGTPMTRVVAAGDTIRGVGKSDYEVAASRATEAAEELPGIAADVKVILANAKTTGARVNAIAREGGRSSFGTQLGELLRKFSGGTGSASRLARDPELRRRISGTMAATDSLRTLLSSRMAEVGRFRRDSSLGRSVQSLRDDVVMLRAMTRNQNGTVGRITADSALVQGLDSLFSELSALMADIKKNPLRYARVF
jgi:phospholipid/cholesterol/gamma-HCH transport system substrate-binding protein